MKQILILALIALIPLNGIAQGRKYKKSMSRNLEVLAGEPERESWIACAGQFEEISSKYPDRWLPSYYASQALTTISLGEQDIERGDEQLDHAQELLDRAMELNPEESEVHTLKALLLLGRMSLDPYSRGALYYEEYLSTLQKAKNLNPENPRVYLLEGIMTLNMPDYMGGGPAAAKPILVEAEKKFSTFHNDDPFWPAWGADLNRQQLDQIE
ncbi:MAG: hypothetical protein EHM46_06920 [Bacteroidetes bacterium]|nr:MAG: hypothetical protein EHM46_06920 [Bacteroidota bacterium]